ncbi:unnamed protein product, partial [Polarella glacialis]
VLRPALVGGAAEVAEVADVSLAPRFEELVAGRDEVWVVVFVKAGVPGAAWSKAASKLRDLVRFGRVDCSKGADFGHAAAPCARAGKGEHVLGYSFNDRGE